MLPKSLSDHNPVLLVEECNNWGPKPFRFYNYMLQEDGFVGAVESSLSNLRRGIGGRGLFSLLRGTKQAIRNWPRNNHRGLSDAISELESRINGLELKLQEEGTSFQERDLMIVARKELWNLHRKEESIWLQRSRVAEEVISEPDQLRGFVFNYFKDNFNSMIKRSYLKLDSQNRRCGRQSSTRTVPKHRGQTVSQWVSLRNFGHSEVIHYEICRGLYNGRIWEHGVNHSFLTLIPKTRNPEARRLAAVISVLVSPSQFAFIPGRQLLDCVFLANEVIDDWRKKERKGVFKVDFEGLMIRWNGRYC
ncbi:uncharacterized protein LOC120144220 [Hibiscus syriacus]|uniref:uncharacterized protein LOC120144220 n=1 Tax=Hibiscus syriacus TaxID=106335 RepID=UPI00192097F0|nr:uncharacterized protein LOC120144220 [Hibiscus syriacus]